MREDYLDNFMNRIEINCSKLYSKSSNYKIIICTNKDYLKHIIFKVNFVLIDSTFKFNNNNYKDIIT